MHFRPSSCIRLIREIAEIEVACHLDILCFWRLFKGGEFCGERR